MNSDLELALMEEELNYDDYYDDELGEYENSGSNDIDGVFNDDVDGVSNDVVVSNDDVVSNDGVDVGSNGSNDSIDLLDETLNKDTEGMLAEEFYKTNQNNSVIITQCDTCGKIYKHNAMTTLYNDINICWHCLFYINYSVDSRSFVDGVYGKTIVEYILECRDNHDKNTCFRSESCFLCDNLNGKKIEGVIDCDLLDIPLSSESNNDEFSIEI